MACFVFASAAALRLARFNAQAGSADKRYFQGLPSPAAAAVIAGMVWLGHASGLPDGATIIVFSFPVTLLTAILMVSNIRYHSFKQFDLRGKVPFFNVSIIVLIIVLIALRPSLVLFLLALGYAISGPLLTLILLRRHRASRAVQEDP